MTPLIGIAITRVISKNVDYVISPCDVCFLLFLHRYIAICHPMKAQTVCTVSRAKRIIAIVWFFTCIYCMLWFFLVDIQVNKNQQVECGYKVSRNLYLPIYFTDFAIFYVIPLFVATILYGLIGRILFLSPIPNHPESTTERWREKSSKEKNGAESDSNKLTNRNRPKGALSSRKQVLCKFIPN